jgi:hypothetical protein
MRFLVTWDLCASDLEGGSLTEFDDRLCPMTDFGISVVGPCCHAIKLQLLTLLFFYDAEHVQNVLLMCVYK